jgi:hypothetical protein
VTNWPSKLKPKLSRYCPRFFALLSVGFICWTALLGPSAQANEWPQVLRAVVLIEDDATLPPSVAKKTLAGVEDFLRKSPSYSLLESEDLAERIGHSADVLVSQCEQDRRCWTTAVNRAGVDVLVHLAIGFSGSREQVWIHVFGETGPLRNEATESLLPRGGGAPLDALNNLLHQGANLRIALESGTTHLQVNGSPRLLRPSKHIRLSKMPPGKHEIVLEGLGLPPRIEVISILPGKNVEMPLRKTTTASTQPVQKWWGAWAGGGLFVGGILAVWAGQTHGAQAWR